VSNEMLATSAFQHSFPLTASMIQIAKFSHQFVAYFARNMYLSLLDSSPPETNRSLLLRVLL